MKTGIQHLYIPGPTNVPEAVRQAMMVPMQDHRAPDFGDLGLGLFRDLKPLFKTEAGKVMIFPGSGTAAWEAAITNTLNPGDKVLMARHGQFSHLWIEMAKRLGLDVQVVDLAWGAGTPINEFARILGNDRHGLIKAVFVTHNETATGVTSDVALVRRDGLRLLLPLLLRLQGRPHDDAGLLERDGEARQGPQSVPRRLPAVRRRR